ncbi:hypothetical protein RDI58_019595 [Solanum bulbocastanum]|uniref:Uncharacterized protein n=1 Tax=Solanum bulbocastanum TaxID=147425 RepID=A0AAN8T5J5_SOLBU
MEEVTNQAMISSPLIFMLSSFYSINIVSVMFAGDFGNVQLAASNLATSWAVVADTSFFSTAIALLWLYSETILIQLFHQDHEIAKEAGLFLKFLIPGLFGYGFLQNVLRFLRAHSILDPILLFSMASLVIHIAIIAYALVYWTGLGFKGASLATSISIWIQLIIFGLFMFFSKHIKWDYAFSFEPFHFHHILTNLKLALPSAAMVCDSAEIINKFASMVPLLLISFVLEFTQGNLSGVVRGCGWERYARLGSILFHRHPNSSPRCFQVQLT